MIFLKNGAYIEAKQNIENGIPISQATLEDLKVLKKTYSTEIARELSKPAQKCDNGWVRKMQQDKYEIEDLIRKAIVA